MAGERTEKATPKRREEARKKGQVARRPELPAAAGFLSAVVALRVLGGDIVGRAAALFAGTLAHAGGAESLTAETAHAALV